MDAKDREIERLGRRIAEQGDEIERLGGEVNRLIERLEADDAGLRASNAALLKSLRELSAWISDIPDPEEALLRADVAIAKAKAEGGG